MPDKAVCKELWSIVGDALGAFLYRETQGEAAVWRLGSGLPRGRETRRMLDNNNNSRHPRRAARKHMGRRTHVPSAGISLSVRRFPPTRKRRPSRKRERPGAPA